MYICKKIFKHDSKEKKCNDDRRCSLRSFRNENEDIQRERRTFNNGEGYYLSD